MEINMVNKLMHMQAVKKQQGATLLGMLIVGAFVVFVALIVMKVAPAYIEFMSVKKSAKSYAV